MTVNKIMANVTTRVGQKKDKFMKTERERQRE